MLIDSNYSKNNNNIIIRTMKSIFEKEQFSVLKPAPKKAIILY